MARMGKSKKSFREIVEEQRAWQNALRDEMVSWNHESLQQDYQYRYGFLQKICEQAGVDFAKMEKELAVQHGKNTEQAMEHLAELEQKVIKRVAREKEDFNRNAALYAEATSGAYEKFFHNPTLRMKTPVDYWPERTSPPPGMYGGGGDIPRAEINPAADLVVHPTTGAEVPVELHPSCSATVGPDFCEGTAEASLAQHLIYEHDAPPGDWFWLDRVWIALEAFGCTTRYTGHSVGAISQTLELRTQTEWGFKLSIRQEGWSTGVVIVDWSDSRSAGARMFWESEIVACEPVIYDQTLRTSPSSVILLQGDESGGGRVEVHLEIWCRAFAHSKDATSSVSFSPPNGITVREIALIPRG